MPVSCRTYRPGRLHRYLIGIGSNKRHGVFGKPDQVVREAIGWLDSDGLHLGIAARRVESSPIGPSRRRYVNSVVLIVSRLPPPEVLERLKIIEKRFGRRGGGQRWGARVLDLVIVLWEGGLWRSPGLFIPHPDFRNRTFVLGPALELAPDWRDPLTGLTLRQLHARLTRPRPLPKARGVVGPVAQ